MRGWMAALLAVLAAATAQAARVEVAPANPTPGEVFRVTVRDWQGTAPPRAAFGDREFALWQVGDGAWEGLVAVDRDRAPGDATLELRGTRDEPSQAVPVPVARREYPEQHLRVREGQVHLSDADRERAARENRAIRKALARVSGRRLWREPFLQPVDGPVTSTFGVRRVYNGTPRGYHSGLDLAAPRGTPVHSAAGGTVALVGDYFYTGNTVFVDHGLGLFTAYFHLDAVAVRPGQAVARGQELGQVGSTGRSTGPHLHWGVYLSGRKADPLSLLRAYGAAGGGESP